MLDPKQLVFDTLQSDNFQPESSPGAGDGKGWRLCKNGDFQIGTATCLNGEIFSPHGNVRVDSRQFELGYDPDKQRYLDEKYLREAGITPARVMKAQMATQCDLEVIVRVDLPEGADPVEAEGYAHRLRQIVMDTVKSEKTLQGLRSGRVTTEQTMREGTDAALASRISSLAGVGMGLDMGKEFLYVKQPGGPVSIGDLQKCCGRDTFTEQFLNREVRSDLKPEVVCALSMAAPITANGKPPLNILPQEVDDGK